MADKKYRLTFSFSDGSAKSVQFTAPQGEKGDKGDSADDVIPSYVRTEADRVAALAQSRQNVNTLTFLASSDFHHSTVHATYAAGMQSSIMHCGQAMGLIRKSVHIDFAAMLGDLIWGSGETKAQALDAVRYVNKQLHAGYAGIPNFRAKGNYESFPRRFCRL